MSMKFESFVDLVSRLALIESENCWSFFRDEKIMYVQFSRWVKDGKLIQIGRGLYLLADRYRRVDIDEFHLAGMLRRPSYVSLEKALEYHGIIPEAVSVFTCVTSKRPVRLDTPLGVFDYRHIQEQLFWGYQGITLNKQTFFVALPEKALMDLIYLKHINATPEYFEELRLGNLEKFSIERFQAFSQKYAKPKMLKAAQHFMEYLNRRKNDEGVKRT